MSASVTVKDLRKSHPSWTWSVLRTGFGSYVYHGTKGGRSVEVYAVGMLCGPAEDDFCTQWRVVDDGGSSESYAQWWFAELVWSQDCHV